MREYVFTLPDGSKRYEIIDTHAACSVARQLAIFTKLHGAVHAGPLCRSPL